MFCSKYKILCIYSYMFKTLIIILFSPKDFVVLKFGFIYFKSRFSCTNIYPLFVYEHLLNDTNNNKLNTM